MFSHRQTAELVVGAAIAAAVTLVYVVYTGRAIGTSEYADFSAALSAIYLVGLTVSPMTPTIARLTARYRSRGERRAVVALRHAAMRHMGAAGAAVTLVGLATSSLIARVLHFRSAMPLVLAFAAVLMLSLISVDRGEAQGLFRFRLYNVNIILESVLRLAIAVLLLQRARTASAALIAYVVGLAVSELVLAGALRDVCPDAKEQTVDWQEVRRLAIPMVMLMFLLAVFQNADMLVVKRWFPAQQSGLYGAASLMARTFGVIFAPLYVLAGPVMTAAHEARRSITAVALRLCGWFIALAAGPLAVLAIWPRPLLRALYGVPFADAAPLVAPLSGVAIIAYTAVLLAQVFITLDDFRFLRVYAIFAVLCLAGLLLWHSSIKQLFAVLYATQGLLLIAMVVMLARLRRGTVQR